MPYALPAVCPDISSAEAQLGQVHATYSVASINLNLCTGLVFIRADGIQPCLYLDKCVHIRTWTTPYIYKLSVASLGSAMLISTYPTLDLSIIT